MAEKLKKNGDEVVKGDQDKLFLEKHDVKALISDLLSQLTANRPEKPLDFMVEYFSSSAEASNRVDKCHRTLMLSHHSRPVFRKNVMTAFDILNQSKVGKNIYGINGAVFDQLLDTLLIGFPNHSQVKERLSRRSQEVLTFEAFSYAVTAVIIMKEYLHVAKDLFTLLDVRKVGLVDRIYSESLLATLQEIFTESSQSSIEACFRLSPDQLYFTLSQVMTTPTSNRKTINQDQFMELASNAFLVTIHDYS